MGRHRDFPLWEVHRSLQKGVATWASPAPGGFTPLSEQPKDRRGPPIPLKVTLQRSSLTRIQTQLAILLCYLGISCTGRNYAAVPHTLGVPKGQDRPATSSRKVTLQRSSLTRIQTQLAILLYYPGTPCTGRNFAAVPHTLGAPKGQDRPANSSRKVTLKRSFLTKTETQFTLLLYTCT